MRRVTAAEYDDYAELPGHSEGGVFMDVRFMYDICGKIVGRMTYPSGYETEPTPILYEIGNPDERGE